MGFCSVLWEILRMNQSVGPVCFVSKQVKMYAKRDVDCSFLMALGCKYDPKDPARMSNEHGKHLKQDCIGGTFQVGLALNLEQRLCLSLLPLCEGHCWLVASDQ